MSIWVSLKLSYKIIQWWNTIYWGPLCESICMWYRHKYRRQQHPTPVLLPGESQGQRSLVAAVRGVAKGQTRLRDFTFTFHFHAPEKEMATHSSVLAWRIPGTGEPGGLPSLGSHRSDMTEVTYLAAAAARHTHMHIVYRHKDTCSRTLGLNIIFTSYCETLEIPE